ILDEAHYCKSNVAKRSLAALQVARRAGRAMLLSGTPMPNHPGELWAPIRALWPEIPRELGLKSYNEWFDYFNIYRVTRYGKRPVAARNLDQLRPYLQRIMLRRTADVVNLPPLRVTLSL